MTSVWVNNVTWPEMFVHNMQNSSFVKTKQQKTVMPINKNHTIHLKSFRSCNCGAAGPLLVISQAACAAGSHVYAQSKETESLKCMPLFTLGIIQD